MGRYSSNVMVCDDYEQKSGNNSNKSLTEKLSHDVKLMRETKGRVLFLRYKPLLNSRKSITEDDLRKLSGKFGKVTRVVIIRPKFNGPMTHAFVELENPEHAANMLEAYLKNPPFISGVKILVDKSNYKEWKKDGSDVGRRSGGSRLKRSRSGSNSSKNAKSRKTNGSSSPSNNKDNEGKSLSIKDRLGVKKSPKTNDKVKGSSKKLDPTDLRNMLKNSDQTVDGQDEIKEEETMKETNTVKETNENPSLVAAAPAEDLYDMTDDLLVHDEDFVMPMDEKTERNEKEELEAAAEVLASLSDDKNNFDVKGAVDIDEDVSISKALESEEKDPADDNLETMLDMDVETAQNGDHSKDEDKVENQDDEFGDETENNNDQTSNNDQKNEDDDGYEDNETEKNHEDAKVETEDSGKETEIKPEVEVEPVAYVEADKDENKEKEEEQSKDQGT